MAEDRRFYVYMYFRADGTPLYVGKGCGRRWVQHHANAANTNIHFRRVIAAAVELPRVRIREYLTSEEAKTLEIALIAAIGREDKKDGPLVNMTDGGDGRFGNIVTEDTRERIRRANTGRVVSEITRAAMSAAGKGRAKSKEHREKIGLGHKGKKLSEECKEKIREAGIANLALHCEYARLQHAKMTNAERTSRSLKISEATKTAMANAEVHKRLIEGCLRRPSPPPNKGRTGVPHTAETRAKMAARWAERKVGGYVKPRHTLETRMKMSAAQQRNAEVRRNGHV